MVPLHEACGPVEGEKFDGVQPADGPLHQLPSFLPLLPQAHVDWGRNFAGLEMLNEMNPGEVTAGINPT